MNGWIAIGVAIATLVATVIVQLLGASHTRGTLTEKVATHDREINDIKTVNDRQWCTIGWHGENIAALNAVTGIKAPERRQDREM